MLAIQRYIGAIYDGINSAIDAGFDCTNDEGLISLNKVNENISLRAWSELNDIDDGLWEAALAGFKAQLDFEDRVYHV